MATFTSQIAILLLLLLSATIFCRSMPSNHRVVRCNEKDRGTLLIFRKGIIDAYDRLSTWSTEEDCCAWKGVHCDNITGRVTKLDLNLPLTSVEEQYKPLEGEINFSFLELEFLNYLDLSGNELDVISIPPIRHNVTRASNLCYLDLSWNHYDLRMDNLHWLSRLSSLKYLNLGRIDLHKETNWLQLVAMLPSLSELRLSDCNLNNSSPSLEYVNFTSLVTLDLSNNNFSSELPKWLFNLKSGISELDLQGCSLHGEIPSTMLHLQNLKHLLYLDLSWNPNLHMDNLHWLFPLSSLKYLNLSGIDLHKESNWLQVVAMLPSLSELRLTNCNLNNFNASLEYVNFTSLVTLDLSGNNFSFELPIWLFNLAEDISYLDLSFSNIHGEIPSSLLNLHNLTYLDLSYNQFNGSIPDWIWQLEHLQHLDLSHNMFGGSIPSTLGNLSYLVSLSLGSNYFSGAISEVTFSNLSSLHDLDLSNSTFAFQFDPAWVPPFQLDNLDLSNTNQGPNFPSWIYTQKSLQDVDLSSSGISLVNNGNKFWSFVEGISVLCLSNNSMRGDISNLTLKSSHLELHRNNFTGGLPHISPKVKYVDLSHNSFSGLIPRSWQNLEVLRFINLWSNRLSGEVLVHLSNSKNLEVMNLGKNEFYGTIPIKMSQNLELIILRANQFEGNIPPQLFNLSSLFHLDLAYNKLSGSIPQCVYNMTRMVTYIDGWLPTTIDLFTKGEDYVYLDNPRRRTIDLSANNLSGEVPSELFRLNQVQTLNLSHNNLTGTIPNTIGGMKDLESLDLSNNKLSGEIPQSMALLTFLSYLNLSCNDFIGRIPTGTQLQSFNASSYTGNLELCGVPLKKCIREEENPENAKPSVGNNDVDPLRESLYLGMGVGFAVGFWGICGALFLIKKWRHAYYRFFHQVTDQFYVTLMVRLNSFRKNWAPAS